MPIQIKTIRRLKFDWSNFIVSVGAITCIGIWFGWQAALAAGIYGWYCEWRASAFIYDAVNQLLEQFDDNYVDEAIDKHNDRNEVPEKE